MRSLIVVADHAMVIQAIRRGLRHTAGFEVVATLDGRRPAGGRLAELQPDVVVVDEMRERPHALSRLQEAGKEVPGAKIVLLSSTLDDSSVGDALEAGAHAVISRQLHPATLGTLLREVVHGNVVHDPRAPREDPSLMAASALTSRELEVLRLVAEGRRNGDVSQALCVSEQTVKFHLYNIYRKLGVGNRTEAARHAHLHLLVGERPASARKAA